MSANKTQTTDADVGAFLDAVSPATKATDARAPNALFRQVTGLQPARLLDNGAPL